MVAPVDEPIARTTRLSSEQLMERIQRINPTARTEFLTRFRPAALSLYLDHLLTVKTSPRGAEARWVRPGETAAMMVRVPAE